MWSRPHFRNSFPSHSQMTSGMSPWVSAVFNKTRGDSIHSKAARWQPRCHQKQGSSWGTTRSWQQQCDSHHTGLYVLVGIHTGIVWPFWNVSVLGGKKIKQFPYSGKIGTSSVIRKDENSIHQREKLLISCNFILEISTWSLSALKWQSRQNPATVMFSEDSRGRKSLDNSRQYLGAPLLGPSASGQLLLIDLSFPEGMNESVKYDTILSTTHVCFRILGQSWL